MIVKCYFKSQTAALGARISLGALYGCSQPMNTSPEQGRAWLLQVRIPNGYLLNGRPNEQVFSRIVSIVNRYDGLIISDQAAEATP